MSENKTLMSENNVKQGTILHQSEKKKNPNDNMFYKFL